MITAAALAQALGGEVVRVGGEEQVLAPGIGHSAADRSLSIRIRPRGLAVHSFAGDDVGAARAHLRKICGKGTRTTRWAAPRARSLGPPKPSPAALWLWSESTHPWNTRAERYLNKRGLFLPASAEAAIRFNHHCKFKGEVVTAMIALVSSAFASGRTARSRLKPYLGSWTNLGHWHIRPRVEGRLRIHGTTA